MPSTPITRRAAVLGAATVALVTTTTACATYGRRPEDDVVPADPGDRSGNTGGAVTALAATADVPVGGGIVLADAQLVVTQPEAGRFAAFSAVCTHQGCTVADVAGGTITCTCHGSKFAIADGSVAQGPAKKPLARKEVNVSGDSLTLA